MSTENKGKNEGTSQRRAVNGATAKPDGGKRGSVAKKTEKSGAAKAKNVVKNAGRARSAAEPKRSYASTAKRTVGSSATVGKINGGRELPKTAKVLLRIAAVLVVLIVIVTIWTNTTGWSLSEAVDNIKLSIKDSSSMGSQKGTFPLPLSGTSSVKEEKLAGGVAVLTDTSLTVYNKKGGMAVNSAHYMANPAMRTSGHYAMVYDIGGVRWRLETASGTLSTGKAPGNITCCAPAACGRYAIACDDDSRLSQIFVYDREGNALFGWHSADYYITSVAISENGEYLTALGVNASGGVICSAMIVFNVEESREVIRREFNDQMLLDVGYLKSGCAVAVGENTLVRVAGDVREIEEIKLGGQVSSYDFDRDSGVAVFLSGVDSSKVVAYDTKVNKRFEKAFTNGAADVSISDSHLCVLYHGEIRCFDLRGKEETPLETAVDAKRVLTYGDDAYILCNSVLRSGEID